MGARLLFDSVRGSRGTRLEVNYIPGKGLLADDAGKN